MGEEGNDPDLNFPGDSEEEGVVRCDLFGASAFPGSRWLYLLPKHPNQSRARSKIRASATPTPIPLIFVAFREDLARLSADAKQTPGQLQTRCVKLRPLVSFVKHKGFFGAATLKHSLADE